jgi:type IV fimbrial biogenesis protein FimT
MCRHLNQLPQHSGFTLIEAMTGMSIGMLLLTTAIPAMQALTQRNLYSTHINSFVSHLHYSRSEAIKRGTPVVMCRSTDERRCSQTAGWHTGWIIFADNNQNRELDTQETVLRVQQGWEDGINVTSGRRRRVVYQPNGFSPGTNGTYVFCNPAYPELARAVILSNTGRPRLSETRPDGSSLRCG